MTLEITGPERTAAAPLVPAQNRCPAGVHTDGIPAYLTLAPRARPGTSLTLAPVDPHDSLDDISKRLYASAAAGLVIAAATAFTLHELDWPMHTRLGQLLGALLVLGVSMFVGGGTTGSIRPRHHIGGDH